MALGMLITKPPAMSADFKNRSQVDERPSSKRPREDDAEDLPAKKLDTVEDMTVEHAIPSDKVGLVIGRSGENIRRLQTETNCTLQIAPEVPGEAGRICKITGTYEDRRRCGESIDKICSLRPDIGGHQRSPSVTIELTLPPGKAGLVIGKNGETIKRLQKEANVRMMVIQNDASDRWIAKPLRITGRPEDCERAQRLVDQCLDGRTEVSYTVHSSQCGRLIGKGGETIRSFSQESGARIEIQKIASVDDPEGKTFIIRGTADQIERARQLIVDKIGDLPPPNVQTPATVPQQAVQWQSAHQWLDVAHSHGMVPPTQEPAAQQALFPYPYPYYGYEQTAVAPSYPAHLGTWMPPYPGLQPQNVALAPYSHHRAWADYYRAMGMVREAEAAEKSIAPHK